MWIDYLAHMHSLTYSGYLWRWEDFSLITLLIFLVKYKDFGKAMVNIMLIFQNIYMYPVAEWLAYFPYDSSLPVRAAFFKKISWLKGHWNVPAIQSTEWWLKGDWMVTERWLNGAFQSPRNGGVSSCESYCELSD